MAGDANRDDSGEAIRELRLGDADTVPDRYGISLAVELLDDVVSLPDPPRLRVTMRNRSDVDRAFTSTSLRVFGGAAADSGEHRLVLYVDAPHEFADHPLRPNGENMAWDSAYRINRLAPGEVSTIELNVWDGPSNSGNVFEPGRYRFADEYFRGTGAEEECAFTWGFEIAVEGSTEPTD